MSIIEAALRRQRLRGANPAQAAELDTAILRESEAPPGRSERIAESTLGRGDLVRPVPPRSDVRIEVTPALLRAAGLYPPQQHERRVVDQLRNIKRPIVNKARSRSEPSGELHRLVMVSSAMPGEGKTFTSVNLAMSLALEKDMSVLLVDADVGKPHISTAFGLSDEPGLLDVLNDRSLSAEALVVPTSMPGLSVLPGGRASEIATELLASERMHDVVSALAAANPRRIVMFDSPPLLLTVESRVLAGIVGQIILVVRAGHTPQQDVLDTLELLDTDRFVGLVLNQSESDSLGTYYGYGYGYRYGYGAAGESAPPLQPGRSE